MRAFQQRRGTARWSSSRARPVPSTTGRVPGAEWRLVRGEARARRSPELPPVCWLAKCFSRSCGTIWAADHSRSILVRRTATTDQPRLIRARTVLRKGGRRCRRPSRSWARSTSARASTTRGGSTSNALLAVLPLTFASLFASRRSRWRICGFNLACRPYGRRQSLS